MMHINGWLFTQHSQIYIHSFLYASHLIKIQLVNSNLAYLYLQARPTAPRIQSPIFNLLSPKLTFTLELRNYLFLITLMVSSFSICAYFHCLECPSLLPLSFKSRFNCLPGLSQAMFPQQSSLIYIIEFIILF